MRVILAPMQGVLDPFVRQLLTEVNDYDLCITEFVRVVDQFLPEKVFYRLCPELKNQGFTSSGTPVRVQLLGQHPMPWYEIQKILQKYANVENEYDSGFYHVARIKQWLRYLNKEYDEANQVFDKIKTCQTAEDLKLRLNDK